LRSQYKIAGSREARKGVSRPSQIGPTPAGWPGSQDDQGPGREEADEQLAEVRAREAQAPNLEITFGQFLDGVALPFYRSKWKFSTASTTENRMTHHSAEFKKKPLKDLTLKTLQTFLDGPLPES